MKTIADNMKTIGVLVKPTVARMKTTVDNMKPSTVS